MNTAVSGSFFLLRLACQRTCIVLACCLFTLVIVLVPMPAKGATTSIQIPASSESPSAKGRATISNLFAQPQGEAHNFTDGSADESPDADGISSSRIELMVGSMIMMGFRGLQLNDDSPFLMAVREGRVGHVVLFDKEATTGLERNIRSSEQVLALTNTLYAAAPGPLLIAAAQEGGLIRSLRPEQGFTDLPSAKTMGRGDARSTRVLGMRLGYDLAKTGINVNLAPTADVDSNPNNPAIGMLERSFSADPNVVAQHSLAFGAGLWDAGVLPTLKHFPGQGSAELDSRFALPDISPLWASQVDLKPYVDAFKHKWPGPVLVGHIYHKNLDPDRPASLSPKVINGLLRTTLGWEGVVISDDLQMKALTDHYSLEDIIFMAVEAGNDILLFGNNLEWDPSLHEKAYATLNKMVQSGKIPKARIEQSWQRIAKLRASRDAQYAQVQARRGS